MGDGTPKISVIVAVFNGSATLQRFLDSYSRQTYPNKELIIMDGGSSDGTVDILKANVEKIAYWESASDRGIYHAWNKALDHVTGDWVCFLGSDDRFWQDDALALVSPYLQSAYPPIRVVYGQVAVLDKAGNVIRYAGNGWDQARKGLLHSLTIPHPGLMHHNSLFERHGRFDESFRITGDYDLLLRELKNGEARFVPGVVTVGFQHGGVSNTPAAIPAQLAELKRIYKKHNIRHSWLKRYSRVSLKMTITAITVRLIGDAGFRTIADGLRRMRGQPAVWR